MNSGELSDLELIGGPDLPEAVLIVDYDERWPRRFEQIATRMRTALGDQMTVEHIGSTSVPGLAAKPIIDVLLIVDNVEDETAYVGPLEGAGFALRAREPGHRLLRTPAQDTNIHVYQQGAEEIVAYLKLRDWLRISDSDRELYGATKRRLAKRRWARGQDYAVAKSDVIDDILDRASRNSEL